MLKILAPITSQLSELEPLLVEYLLTPNKPTNQIIQHIFSSGGKRIRPGIFLLASQAIGYNEEHIYPIASVCEYIHTASLLHDDVIDSSTLRRGKPTTNSVWGDESAVLAGDLIYSAACRLMVKTKCLALIDCFAECIRFMSESELFQLELLWKINTTREQYERVVAGKTAALFEACALTPCYLKQLPENCSELFARYGSLLGFSFQIADDCLDYEGDEGTVGKNMQADLLEGKVTLPLIIAIANSNDDFRSLVAAIIESGEASENQLSKLVQGVRSSGGLTSARDIAFGYATEAKVSLQKGYSMCLELNPPENTDDSNKRELAMESLISLVDFVVKRNK